MIGGVVWTAAVISLRASSLRTRSSASGTFENSGKRRKFISDGKDRKIAALEAKLQQKNEVLAEVMEEFVGLKKELGEL